MRNTFSIIVSFKASGEFLQTNIGSKGPHCGHSLSQNLQPSNAFEAQALGRTCLFLRRFNLYPDAAYHILTLPTNTVRGF